MCRAAEACRTATEYQTLYEKTPLLLRELLVREISIVLATDIQGRNGNTPEDRSETPAE